jgi:hypothetical protein
MTRLRPHTLRARLLFQILPAVALAIVAITAIAIKVAASAQRDAVYREMSQQIAREAAGFDGDVRRAQAIAHDLGTAVEADTTRDRARGAAVTEQFAIDHPELLGTWVAYEPNAYRADAGYVSRGLQGDNQGRFAVWAERLKGPLHVAAFENPKDNPWGDDDYYVRPVKGGFDGMLEPYLESGAMMTSYVAPIERGGKRVGVAAVDLSLKSLDDRIKGVKMLQSGYAFVAAENGLLVAYPGQKGWAGKKTVAQIGSQRHAPGMAGPGRREGGPRGPHRDGGSGDR